MSASNYTFDIDVESNESPARAWSRHWELRVDVSVSGGYLPASMDSPAEAPEISYVITQVLEYGSFDDISDDDVWSAVCSKLDDLREG